MKKSGISAIVATILIILITVAAVAVVWGAVIPMLEQGEGFGTYNADIVIETNGGYTYFDSTKGVACVQVKRLSSDLNLTRIDVLFTYNGTTLSSKGNFSGDKLPVGIELKQKCFNLTFVTVKVDGKWVAPDSITVVPIYFDGINEVVGDVTATVTSSTGNSGSGNLGGGNFPDSGSADVIKMCDVGEEYYIGVCYPVAIPGSKEISNCWQLQNIDDEDFGGGLADSYVLGNDIDCSVISNFDPIGSNSNIFSGSFDGDGFEISGLSIANDGDYVGLFGRTGSGVEISNVEVVDVDIDGGSYVGGLVGFNYATITNSYVTGSVGSSKDYVGGLVGRNSGTINSSYFVGSVIGNNGYAGGLVGGSLWGTITNSYVAGSVSSNSGHVAGLTGRNKDSIVTNSYSIASISGDGARVGGLVGYPKGVTFSYYDNETVECIVGGVSLDCFDVKYGELTKNLKSEDWLSGNGWDFEIVWKIDVDEYPKLIWE